MWLKKGVGLTSAQWYFFDLAGGGMQEGSPRYFELVKKKCPRLTPFDILFFKHGVFSGEKNLEA